MKPGERLATEEYERQVVYIDREMAALRAEFDKLLSQVRQSKIIAADAVRREQIAIEEARVLRAKLQDLRETTLGDLERLFERGLQ